MDMFLPLLGVVVGGVLTLVGSFAAKIWDEWRQAVALRGAFRAEISGIISIAALRKHEALVEHIITAWKSGNNIPIAFYGLEKASRDPIYTGNVSRIGSIGRHLSAEVATFYTNLLAVRIVLEAFNDAATQALPLPSKIDMAEEALALWRKTKADGAALVAKL
jgi:hypothetical protein